MTSSWQYLNPLGPLLPMIIIIMFCCLKKVPDIESIMRVIIVGNLSHDRYWKISIYHFRVCRMHAGTMLGVEFRCCADMCGAGWEWKGVLCARRWWRCAVVVSWWMRNVANTLGAGWRDSAEAHHDDDDDDDDDRRTSCTPKTSHRFSSCQVCHPILYWVFSINN